MSAVVAVVRASGVAVIHLPSCAYLSKEVRTLEDEWTYTPGDRPCSRCRPDDEFAAAKKIATTRPAHHRPAASTEESTK